MLLLVAVLAGAVQCGQLWPSTCKGEGWGGADVQEQEL